MRTQFQVTDHMPQFQVKMVSKPRKPNLLNLRYLYKSSDSVKLEPDIYCVC